MRLSCRKATQMLVIQASVDTALNVSLALSFGLTYVVRRGKGVSLPT